VLLATIRQQIIEKLKASRMTAHDLSRELRQSEQEILKHLPHVARSLASTGRRLVMEPPVCLSCGFRFKKRDRMRAPSRCPLCRAEHITEPSFSIERESGVKKAGSGLES
jgi:predicted Zn-ribbon and HTH transcriptional regulator